MVSLLRTLLPILSLALAVSNPALAFSDLFVFGDSIVDAGNTRGSALFFGLDDPAPPATGYFPGRFTNGPNFADVLNEAIAGELSVPSVGAAMGDNFSYGGARAIPDGGFIPALGAQTDAFLVREAGMADPNALYFIHIGGNDVRDIVLDGLDPAATIASAVGETLASIESLADAGARDFLVAGVGNVGTIPEILERSAMDQMTGVQASRDYNDALFEALADLEATRGLKITAFDALGFAEAALADPAAFGFPADLDVTGTCTGVAFDAPGGRDDGCSGFAFFDAVHPTTAVNRALAEAALAAVPEPGTGLLVGFGLALCARARRGRRLTA